MKSFRLRHNLRPPELLSRSLMAGALLLLPACAKKDEAAVDTGAAMAPAPAAMDTGMRPMDTGMSVDSAPVKDSTIKTPVIIARPGPPAPPPPANPPDPDSALESEIKKLRPATVSFESPDTLFIDQPAKVTVEISPKGSVATPDTGGRPVVPDTTRISRITQVCLSASEFRIQNESGEEKTCRDQPVSLNKSSTWSWILTALPNIKSSGPRPVMVTVNALLPGHPPYTVYSSTHTTFVHVSSPSMMKQLQTFLDEWKALLLSLAAIVGVLLPFIRWLRARRGVS